jgi:hypothetical protein
MVNVVRREETWVIVWWKPQSEQICFDLRTERDVEPFKTIIIIIILTANGFYPVAVVLQ